MVLLSFFDLEFCFFRIFYTELIIHPVDQISNFVMPCCLLVISSEIAVMVNVHRPSWVFLNFVGQKIMFRTHNRTTKNIDLIM